LFPRRSTLTVTTRLTLKDNNAISHHCGLQDSNSKVPKISKVCSQYDDLFSFVEPKDKYK